MHLGNGVKPQVLESYHSPASNPVTRGKKFKLQGGHFAAAHFFRRSWALSHSIERHCPRVTDEEAEAQVTAMASVTQLVSGRCGMPFVPGPAGSLPPLRTI